MDSWKRVFRDGIAPQLCTAGLEALRFGLQRDDARLIQGATTSPPPMECVLTWKPEGACPIGYAGWQGSHLETVGAVEEFFANVCFECDNRMHERASARYFVTWFDDMPRDEVRRLLLAEVERALAERMGVADPFVVRGREETALSV